MMRRLGYAVFLAFGMLLAAFSPVLAQDPPSRTTIAIAQEYWVYDRGEQFGPFVFQQVLDRIATGESNLGTQVWTSHLNAWVNIDTMPEFATALAEAPVEYWVFDNNTQFGPLSLEEVRQRIARGESNASTQVWTMQLNAWVMLPDVPELAEMLEGGSTVVAEGAPYYLFEFDQQKGPFSKDDLIDQIARGDIGRSGYVWAPGMADWVGIETVPEFAAAFAPEVELEKPYYVIANGERVGPLTDSEIRIRILDGLSTAEDLAWKKGLADWTPLSEFGELADALAAVEGPPPLPGEEDGPPPLPGDDDHKIAVITPQDDDATKKLFEDAMTVFELGLPDATPTAPTRARAQALECIAQEVAGLGPDDLQIFIDHGVQLDEGMLAGIDANTPGFSAAVSLCVEQAESMRDMLDALLWQVVDERVGADGPDDVRIEAFACMREAIDPLSDAHRAALAAEGMNTSEGTIKKLEDAYPGITAAVEACQATVTAALGTPIDGGVVTPPVVEDKPEVVVLPKDEEKPPVIIAPKIGITDGPEIEEKKDEATVTQPKVVEPAKGVDERLRDVIQEIYDQQARDLPEAIRNDMVACTAGKYSVLNADEKELMIANKMMISEGEMARIEAAHPGVTASLSDCIPKF